jgi:hypothetical protein
MNSADRKKLKKLALVRLDATADDDEQWSFLFRTDGCVGYLYCPWSATEDWDFDGTIEGLDLPWSAERLNLIKDGKADPTENELRQWRQAKCRSLASGSDWCWIAWIVPLWIDQKIAGYALFVSSVPSVTDDSQVAANQSGCGHETGRYLHLREPAEPGSARGDHRGS